MPNTPFNRRAPAVAQATALCCVLTLALTACGGGSSEIAATSSATSTDTGTGTGTASTGTTAPTTTVTSPTTTTTTTLAGTSSTAGVLCAFNQSLFNSSASVNATSSASWSCTTTNRVLSANGLPDHVVGTFPNADNPNRISAQTVAASATLTPAVVSTAGAAATVVGYALNGVQFDPNTGGTCDNAGTSCSLIGGSGNWRMEALGQTSFKFGTDSSNAHVQPGWRIPLPRHARRLHHPQLGKGEAMALVGFCLWTASPCMRAMATTVATDAAFGTSRCSWCPATALKSTPEQSAGRPPALVPDGDLHCRTMNTWPAWGDLDECNGPHRRDAGVPAGHLPLHDHRHLSVHPALRQGHGHRHRRCGWPAAALITAKDHPCQCK
jgi:hypothetical protein